MYESALVDHIGEVLKLVPEEFRDGVETMLREIPKARTLSIGYVAKDSEVFGPNGEDGISVFMNGHMSDKIALARIFTVHADRMI